MINTYLARVTLFFMFSPSYMCKLRKKQKQPNSRLHTNREETGDRRRRENLSCLPALARRSRVLATIWKHISEIFILFLFLGIHGDPKCRGEVCRPGGREEVGSRVAWAAPFDMIICRFRATMAQKKWRTCYVLRVSCMSVHIPIPKFVCKPQRAKQLKSKPSRFTFKAHDGGGRHDPDVLCPE